MDVVDSICMSLFKLLIMMAGLSLLSYNCEGTGAQKIKYIQDVIKQYCPSLMCFQETWLIDSNHNVLDHISYDYRSFSVSGVEHQSKILSGRSYGGVAILVNNAFREVKQIPSFSSRICAVKCMVDNMKVLIYYVYMPCDMQISRVSDEYIDTLNCLETLLQGNSYSQVLLEGDWNTDFSRGNTQSRELSNFLTKNSLDVVPHNEPYTY